MDFLTKVTFDISINLPFWFLNRNPFRTVQHWRQISRKYSGFVESEFVKTCDELVKGWPAEVAFATQNGIHSWFCLKCQLYSVFITFHLEFGYFSLTYYLELLGLWIKSLNIRHFWQVHGLETYKSQHSYSTH